ncbi:hypothetical protein [Stackebrandtia soli]|uniref:hypothetical protein n=1 Tax=Stackebrandtia soli TaxID=1892856 RepID=UPI0039EAD3DE
MFKKDEQESAPRVVRRLEKRLDVAGQLHALEQNPVLEVVDIERLRRSVTRSLWFFLCLGLAFTSAGVQKFMAGDATIDDPIWWACWLVEPAFAGILVTVLRWEAEMLARGIEHRSGWVNTLKWLLLGSTLLMNVLSVGSDTSSGMIAAHIVVPLLVFLLAEVMPVIQRHCTQARRDIELPEPIKDTVETTMEDTVESTAPKLTPATSVPTPVVDVKPAPAPAPAPAPVIMPDPITPPIPAKPVTVDMSPVTVALPESIKDRIAARLVDVIASGETPTVDDVATAGRIPASLAGQVFDQLNGSLASA